MAVVGVIIAGAALAIDRFVVPQDASASAEVPVAASPDGAAPKAAILPRLAEPTLADRLALISNDHGIDGRRDAFVLPISMRLAAERDRAVAREVSEVEVATQSKRAPVAIRSVVDGTHPVVVIGDAAVKLGAKTAAGDVLVGVERGEHGSYLVTLMDSSGLRWTETFVPGSTAPTKKP